MRYLGISRKGWRVVEEVGDGIGARGAMGESGGKIFCGGVKEDSYKIMLFRGIVVHLWWFLPEDETWIDLIALISRSLMRS